MGSKAGRVAVLMKKQLTILGCGSAVPTAKNCPSGQILEMDMAAGEKILIAVFGPLSNAMDDHQLDMGFMLTKYVDNQLIAYAKTEDEDGTYTVSGGALNRDRNIYVMKDGKVVEEGSYNQLMEMKGWFAELAKRQL